MKFDLLLRSSAMALGLLTAAIVSCTNGSADDSAGGSAASPAAGGTGAQTSNTGGAVASAGTSSGATTSMGGTSACPNAASFLITDLENPAQWNAWSTTNDATPGGTQTPSGAFMAEMSTSDLHYSAHTTGNGFTTWGAGLVYNLATAKTCYDFSKFTGFKFRAKGPANLVVAGQVAGVLPPTSGGTCTGMCFDSHKTTVVVGADFADYTVYWNQLQQGGWGDHVDFQAKDLMLLNFEVGPADMPFDYWLDNIAFVDTPPPNSGTGGSGSGGATGTGGGTTVGGATGTGGSVVVPTHKFTDVLSADQFNQMFPQRLGFYTYDNLVTAANRFSSFTAVGDATAQKQEVAAFLANVALETGSLRFTDEQNPQGIYCDSTNATYKCVAGQDYHGRGPLQISWNYNYGAAGASLGQPLLQNPGLVSSDGAITWETAVWFWMSAQSGGRTAHTAMIQNLGFGATIQVINGAVECGGKDSQAVNQRVQFYQSFCALLGVPTGSNLTC